MDISSLDDYAKSHMANRVTSEILEYLKSVDVSAVHSSHVKTPDAIPPEIDGYLYSKTLYVFTADDLRDLIFRIRKEEELGMPMTVV